MKKKLLIVIGMVMALVPVSAQEFIANEDYVYGMGVTDSAAVMALSTSISVSVKSEIKYSVEEQKKNISEDFSKKVELSTSIIVKNSRQYIDERGIYYRYINKRAYIEAKKADYDKFSAMAASLDGSGVKHEINRILGCYYLAYESMDEPLIRAVYGNESEMLRNSILDKAKRLYCGKIYGYLVANEKAPGGYFVKVTGGRRDMNEFEPANLFGFRYYQNGEWKTPKYFYSSILIREGKFSNNDNEKIINKYVRIFSDTPYMPYRLTYEMLYNGELMVMPVPEEWYFSNLKINNPRNLN